MPNIARTLQLKIVDFKAPNSDRFRAMALQTMLRTVLRNAPTAADRHIPDLADANDGDRCNFVDSISPPPGGAQGTAFRFCAYRKGDLPLGLNPDFGRASVDLTASRLADVVTGDPREPVSVFSALAFGQVVIVESSRGAGGTTALEIYLTELFRRHVNPDYPRLYLVDVATREVVTAIDRAGGVKEVVMDIATPHRDAQHRFGQLLSSARRKVSGTDRVRLSYRAASDGTLDTADVLRAYEDLEAEELDRLLIVLKDGSTLIGDDRNKVRRVVSLPTDDQRHFSRHTLVTEMARFLTDLQRVQDGVQVVTQEGLLA